MAFCTNCGAKLADGTKFCTECGTKVENAANIPPQPVPSSQPMETSVPAPENPIPENPPFPGGSPAPAANTGVPGFTFQNGNGGRNKKTGLIIGVVAAVVILLAAVLLFSGISGGSKKADPALLGKYEGVSCSAYGVELGVEDEWIELKSGGKASICLMGETYSGKWTLEGEDLTVTQRGDSFTGTLRNGVIVLDFAGLEYTFAKEGARVPQTTAATAPAEDLSWWEGDWYGWMILQNGTGVWSDSDGNFWDTCARIWVNDDGTGYLELWDEDNEAGQCFAQVDVTFPDARTMVSEEGGFWDMTVSEGDWYVSSDAKPMGPNVDDAICIFGSYVSGENDADTFTFEIFLRPWGVEWEDVRVADPETMPYDDMMPAYYDSWYLPLITSGVTEAPDLIGE